MNLGRRSRGKWKLYRNQGEYAEKSIKRSVARYQERCFIRETSTRFSVERENGADRYQNEVLKEGQHVNLNRMF